MKTGIGVGDLQTVTTPDDPDGQHSRGVDELHWTVDGITSDYLHASMPILRLSDQVEGGVL